jgi:hypothetical protein
MLLHTQQLHLNKQSKLHCVKVPIKAIKHNYIFGITDDSVQEGDKDIDLSSKKEKSRIGEGGKREI